MGIKQSRIAVNKGKAGRKKQQQQQDEEEEEVSIIELTQHGFSSPAREKYFCKCEPLHKAALNGDWEAAHQLLRMDPSLFTTHITQGGETVLHIAAVVGHTTFFYNLLDTIPQQSDLELQNNKGSTALCFAAAAGHLDIAKLMIQKNPKLLTIIARDGITPLFLAVLQGHADMAHYLFSLPTHFELWTEEQQATLLTTSIESELYDLATSIVNKNKRLAVAKNNHGDTALEVLARKPLEFWRSRRHHPRLFHHILNNIMIHKPSLPSRDAYTLFNCLWKNMICQQKERDIETGVDVDDGRTSSLLFIAAESGNCDFVVELIKKDHAFLYKLNSSKHSIFHVAVRHRHVQIFNLIYELRSVKDLILTNIDAEGNNILHLAAMLPNENEINDIPGAALQMQRQVLWYKKVENIVQPLHRNMKNYAGETPEKLFLAQHKSLMKEGQKQMKQIAKSCMLVAMLITTIVFTAAFTVPGGYDNFTGIPILITKKWFMIIPMSEAVASLSSLISMLMFLSILTSSYDADDFLTSLPIWLVTGVMALFVSIVAMMAALGTSLVFYFDGLATIMVFLVCFMSIPLMFIGLKYQLLVTVLRCTYGSPWLFRSNNCLFS